MFTTFSTQLPYHMSLHLHVFKKYKCTFKRRNKYLFKFLWCCYRNWSVNINHVKISYKNELVTYWITCQWHKCKYKRKFSFGRKVNNSVILLTALKWFPPVHFSLQTWWYSMYLLQDWPDTKIILHAFSSLFSNNVKSLWMFSIPGPTTIHSTLSCRSLLLAVITFTTIQALGYNENSILWVHVYLHPCQWIVRHTWRHIPKL
jgi:hypothetical protein